MTLAHLTLAMVGVAGLSACSAANDGAKPDAGSVRPGPRASEAGAGPSMAADTGALCDTTQSGDLFEECYDDTLLRRGSRDVALVDASTLGTGDAPRCPRPDELRSEPPGGEGCASTHLCGPKIIQQDGGFSCCYTVRTTCLPK